MSISEMIVKAVGIVLVLVGLGLILSLVGISVFGVSLSPEWLALVVGLVLLGAGIYVVRGGNITL